MRSRQAAQAHYATLGAAALLLLWVNRGMWFLLDEWAFITDRSLGGADSRGIFQPHNEHWSTIPALVYRALFEVFGVRTYVPFLVVMIAAHLLAAHLLWRVIRRVVGDPWVATAGATVFLFLGAGWENLTRAFQMTLVGSLALGLLWLLLQPTSRRFERRDLLGWLVGVLALMVSGVGVAMVAMVALYALLRRGWRMALAVASVPTLAYLAWVAAYGRQALREGGQPLGQGLRDLPAYVWHGLTGAVDLTTGLAGAGVVVVLVLVGWAVRRGSWPLDARWALAAATAGGAVAQLGFTALRRSQLGIETASESRYLYLVVALLLPSVCLAVDLLLPPRRRLVAVAAVTAAILFVQLPILVDRSREWTTIAGDGRGTFVAAVDLVRSGERLISPTPYPWFAPQVQVNELVELADRGDLPLDPRPTADQILTARTFTQLGARTLAAGEPAPPVIAGRVAVAAARSVTWTEVGDGCLRFSPAGSGPLLQLSLDGPAELALSSENGGAIEAMYVADDGSAASVRAASFPVAAGGWLLIDSVATGPDLRLGLPDGATTVCGLAPLPAPRMTPL